MKKPGPDHQSTWSKTVKCVWNCKVLDTKRKILVYLFMESSL